MRYALEKTGGLWYNITIYQKALQKREGEEMAAKMLDKGMDVKTIMEVTGLSEDEVRIAAGRAKAA